jgi:hypothetical protein
MWFGRWRPGFLPRPVTRWRELAPMINDAREVHRKKLLAGGPKVLAIPYDS